MKRVFADSSLQLPVSVSDVFLSSLRVFPSSESWTKEDFTNAFTPLVLRFSLPLS